MIKQRTLFRAAVISLIAGVSLSGCGGGDTAATVLRSAQLLTSPPSVFVSGDFGRWHYATDTGATLTFRDNAAELPETSLTFPGTVILLVDLWVVTNTSYLMVGTIDANEHFSLYRYHDAGTDELPDLSTEETVASTTFASYVTSATRETTDGTVYLLDRRCQDVFRSVDTDSDGWADTLSSTAFALTTNFSDLAFASWILATDDGVVHAHEFELPRPRSAHVNVVDALVLTDNDDDGVADTQITEEAFSLSPYLVGPRPFDGQGSIVVATTFHKPGLVAEVWLLDANGADVALLGSGALAGAGNANAATVSLSQTLSEGDPLGLRFSGSMSTQGLVTVMADDPQIVSMTPHSVPDDQATSVTIKGANFASNMALELVKPGGVVVAVTFVFVDSETITAVLPVMPIAGDSENIALRPQANGQSSETVNGFVARVCDPELIG